MTAIGRRGLAIALAGCALAAALPLRAQDLGLERAKAEGWVGELPNGYLGVRVERAGVSGLVDRINAQRRQRYRELALTHGVPTAAIERQAGQRLIERLEPGEYYYGDGDWRQR
jgi:hypothetical protein